MADVNYETKSVQGEGVADPLMASFDAFADIAGLKRDVAALKGRVRASQRPQLAGGVDGVKAASDMGDFDPARAAFVDRYVRRGLETGVELKALSGTVAGDGGYAVPREIDAAIDALVKQASPIRSIANVVQTGSAGYRKLVTSGGTASGWASETGGRAVTTTPVFQEIAPSMGELYANPAASQAMLDDVAFDVESWLAGEIASEFARAEGAAFITGDGVNKPKGFLTYPVNTQVDGTRSFGAMQYIASGAAGAFAASHPGDKLFDLVHALKPAYRQGAVFVMNSATLASIRKFKTSDGAFVWQPGLFAGQPGALLGFPVVEAEDMPVIAADSLSIAFGNFAHGYVIADRGETSILRDPYTNKPFVHFYSVKRVGGGLANSEAIKVMKFAVT